MPIGWRILIVSLIFLGCHKDGSSPQSGHQTMYFPPTTSSVWDTISISDLGWNKTAIQPLRDFLIQKNTKSFMILVNGRIAMEYYLNGHTVDATWQWNSAGKTLMATTTGIAQQEGFLNINNKASDYLGTRWTNMPSDKEALISVRNLLTMTSGIDDSKQLVTKTNLNYVADADTRWAYGNVFQKLTDVVSNATSIPFEIYFNSRLKDRIGMDGRWNFGVIFTIYHSTTRSMARFGLLTLNKGKWQNDQIVNEIFFNNSTSTSQDLNPSYGYLWWLNGKDKYMLPNEQTVYTGMLIPNAPTDMYAAMGAADQRIYVIPSKNMVIIRMGDASDPVHPDFEHSGFDRELWAKINALIN
jgi:CubicO group peptidase (beta-lactamase class C family)